MISKAEWKKFTKDLGKDKLTKDQLLSKIEAQFVSNKPMEDAFDVRDDSKKSVHPTRPAHKLAELNETRKDEIKRGFKIRAKGESEHADEFSKGI